MCQISGASSTGSFGAKIVDSVSHMIQSVMGQKNMVKGPVRPETKNDCAGKGQQ
jgi:hypothetical protein